jgi:hypothetical protein
LTGWDSRRRSRPGRLGLILGPDSVLRLVSDNAQAIFLGLVQTWFGGDEFGGDFGSGGEVDLRGFEEARRHDGGGGGNMVLAEEMGCYRERMRVSRYIVSR